MRTKRGEGSYPKPIKQRGAATLLITLALFLVMVLVALFVNRNLIFEQRASANQYRATQAFEAAEAGLEWAVAQLNHAEPIGADCLPTTGRSADAFRARFLSFVAADSSFASTTWTPRGAAALPLRPACVYGGTDWLCHCPTESDADLLAPVGSGPFPAFTLQFIAGPKPGTVRIVSTGCSSWAAPCQPRAGDPADASARTEVTVALMPAVRAAPLEALTIRSASPNSDRLFAAHFGLDPLRWKNQLVVTRMRCEGECSAALIAAIGRDMPHPMIWVEGELRLIGPLTIGAPDTPVVIVVPEGAQFTGPVALHGALYSASLRWDASASGRGSVQGAVIVEAPPEGDGSPLLVRDAGVLQALMQRTGSFVRVNGSWRDF
ncbi:hypothetical protein BH11PSE8_BH11PSE8_17070 [soil metagenome]